MPDSLKLGGYSEEDLLPLSALADVSFCERRAALHLVERVWEDNVFTAEGMVLHEKVDREPATESRRDLRIARGLRLRSLTLGLSGRADVVEFHRVPLKNAEMSGLAGVPQGVALPGVEGIWCPFPVEYKVGALRRQRGFELQLCAQAMCLEEMLGVPVPSGALFYGKTGRRLDLDFHEQLREETARAATRLHQIVRTGKTPRAKRENKCAKCSLLSMCLPDVTGIRKNVRTYIRKCITQLD